MFEHLAMGTAAGGLRRHRLVHTRLDSIFALAIAQASLELQTGFFDTQSLLRSKSSGAVHGPAFAATPLTQTYLSRAGIRRPSCKRRASPDFSPAC